MRQFVLVSYLLAAPLVSAETDYVVLVSIDGLAAYALENDDVEMPHLRRLQREGVWAQSSESVYPSITHPAHTTLVTGTYPRTHGVIGNRVTDRRTGERFHITNKPHGETVQVPTLFDAAKAEGLRTAAFYWPENYRDPAVDFNIPEVFDGDTADPRAADPGFLDELRQAGIPIDLYYRWYKNKTLKGASDAVLAEAAAYVIRRYRPQFVAAHFLVMDEIQHEYGSEHYLAKGALTAADHALGILLRAIGAAGIAERTTVFVVSDHGFHTVRHEVNLHPLFERRGLVDKVRLHRGSWTLHVELLDSVDLDTVREELDEVFAEALRLEGIAHVLRPRDFHELGYPKYEEHVHVRGHYTIMGDIDTFPISDSSNGSTKRRLRKEPYHGHGYLPSHPRMYPAFVAWGAGIRKGVRVGHVRNVDVAPTLAHLLGLDLGPVEGKVMTEILADVE